METIFVNILDAKDNLEVILDSMESKYLQEYYALFIGAMAYWNFIVLTPELAAKLHIIILNTEIKDKDSNLEKIYDFLLDKSIEDALNEPEN